MGPHHRKLPANRYGIVYRHVAYALFIDFFQRAASTRKFANKWACMTIMHYDRLA